MTEYTFEIIPGTGPFVIKELNEKHANATVCGATSSTIIIKSIDELIESFTDIKTALRVTKDNGLTRNLFRKEWRKETVPASINPVLAHVMCEIAGIEEDDIVLDPFCGSGTIAVTAATEFNPAKVLASDVSGKAVDKTISNFQNTELKKNKYTVFRTNINQLKLQKDSVDVVLANLPFGIRSGNHEENIKTYQHLADRLKVVCKPNARIVLYTLEKKLLREVMETPDFKLEREYQVEVDNLFPGIFFYRKV